MDTNAKKRFDDLLKELQEEQVRKIDISAPINGLRVNTDFTFESNELGKVRMTEHAFSQFCQKAYNYALPADYFKNLYKENPQQFVEQLNYHLEKAKESEHRFRMVQDVSGAQAEIRGIVTDKYIPYDHLDVLTIFQETTKNLPDFEVKNMHMDDKMMFIRFIFPDTEKNFGRAFDGQDDRNFIALDLINSEVGFTSTISNPSVYRLICTNGLVAQEAQYGFYKQRHMNIDPHRVNEDLRKSIVHGVERGQEILHTFGKARQVKIDNPYELITSYGKSKAMSDKMLRTIRTNFDIEPDKSLFGIVNAFTRTATGIKSLEKRLEMEKFANKIMNIELKKSGIAL